MRPTHDQRPKKGIHEGDGKFDQRLTDDDREQGLRRSPERDQHETEGPEGPGDDIGHIRPKEETKFDLFQAVEDWDVDEDVLDKRQDLGSDEGSYPHLKHALVTGRLQISREAHDKRNHRGKKDEANEKNQDGKALRYLLAPEFVHNVQEAEGKENREYARGELRAPKIDNLCPKQRGQDH